MFLPPNVLHIHVCDQANCVLTKGIFKVVNMFLIGLKIGYEVKGGGALFFKFTNLRDFQDI